MDAPLALYRRYRPGTFAEVVGQDHVTIPLCRALDANRVNHAYLFSGPRGCGKTTSARILARSLNCELGPTSTPCGVCRSCRDLAPGGPGSVDVVEIDAASHGGVDDARDLRERAFFTPVASRYKVYVVDEAHMVTTAGFNALLKLVEEPPEHLKFVFATTEPDKVIGTIRSRTHHYPFRLIPPRTMSAHLAGIAEREQVSVAPAVLPLVVRAGDGSARDALSVLDQLIGGSGPEGVTYDDAVALLGYTSDALLDRVVDALAAYDGAEVFAAVDQVVEAGQDPRRFVEDLLRRMRDLVVLAVVPDAGRAELLDVPPETVTALAQQSQTMGRAAALRAAELLDAGLTEIRGATAPRLHLELLMARLLLPAATEGEAGLAARVERLERRLAGPVPTATPVSPALAGPSVAHGSAVATAAAPLPDPSAPAPVSAAPAPAAAFPEAASLDAAPSLSTPPEAVPPLSTPPEAVPPLSTPPEAAPPVERPAQGGRVGSPGAVSLADLRRLWPEVLEALRSTSRVTWMSLQGSQVLGLEPDLLTISVSSEGVRTNFQRGGRDAEVRTAVRDLLALDVRVDVVVGTGASPAGASPVGDGTAGGGRRAGAARRGAGRDGGTGPAAGPANLPPGTPAGPDATDWPVAAAPGGMADDAAGDRPVPATRPPDVGSDGSGPDDGGSGSDGSGSDDAGPQPSVTERLRARATATGSPDDAVAPDDVALDSGGLSTEDLLAREFGAEVIERRSHPG